MKGTYVRVKDGAVVAYDEAFKGGVLQPGYRVHMQSMIMDHQRRIAGDNTMISIHDAIAQIPDEFRRKMQYADGMINGTSRCEIESGIRNLNSIRYALDTAAQGQSFGPLGIVADSDRTLCKRVVEYIDGKIAAAQERAHRL